MINVTRNKSQEVWSRGCVLAEAQNFARWLMDTPSNHMTPTNFVHSVSKRLGQLDSKVKSRIELCPRYSLMIIINLIRTWEVVD